MTIALGIGLFIGGAIVGYLVASLMYWYAKP